MGNKEALQLFGEKRIRTAWNQEEEKWYFSIVDVVSVLTDSPDPAKYWRVLKTRLKKEGSETATNCSTFKMKAADGKMRQTDVADQQQLFRLIQSIPSPKPVSQIHFLKANESPVKAAPSPVTPAKTSKSVSVEL